MSAVKSFPHDTPAAEMRQNRQVRRLLCNAAEACACGVGCPDCKSLAHTFLGVVHHGRRFRCADCRAEFLGPDMFTVINRGATGEHIVGSLCGQTRCTCLAGVHRRNCWAQDGVRDFRLRESADPARAPRPIEGIGDLRNLNDGPPRCERKRYTVANAPWRSA